jgi:hypothetical protein
MSRARHFACAVGALALGFAGAGFADTALVSGQPATLSLPASSYVSNYYLDVDGSAQQLVVNVTAFGGDVDLFLRYATPFPTQDPQAGYPTVSYDLLNRSAQYHSVSSTSNESITVLRSSRVPLQAGRWYIAVINGGNGNASGSLTATTAANVPSATITLDFAHPRSGSSDPANDCDDSFWTDSTPATPVGGNPGTTLGAQRQNALTYAAQQLQQQLQIPIPITVHACGAHLGGDNDSAILAHASPLTFLYDAPQYPLNMLPKKYTWYPATAAVRLSGTSLCGLAGGPCDGVDNEEIEATFNEDIGQSNVIHGEKFYYGYTPGGSGLDFISVAMHEMTHGLGFIGLVNTDTSQGPLGARAGLVIDTTQHTGAIAYQNLTEGPYDDIYDDNVAIVDGTAHTYTPFLGYEVNGSHDAARAAALVSGGTVTSAGSYVPGLYNCGNYIAPCTGLRWLDAVAAGASGTNVNAGRAAPDDFPSLYAPCDKSKTADCTTQPSSTLSHTVQSGDMMNAYYSNENLRSMGLAVPMLAPVGWSNAAATMPTLPTPIPSNWYDRTHNGHGFDFQLAFHDAVNGDVYFMTFYTYEADGTPEWYQAVGHLVDGVFLPSLQSNGGTLYRVRYASNQPGQLNVMPDASVQGTVVIDFNQAANSPACRNSDRSQSAMLGVMAWTIGNESGTWCVEPIVALSAHATPDYNGHWYAPSDSGWGFELVDVANGGGNPTVIVTVYYPGPNNQPTWATGSATLSGGSTPSATMPLYQIANGYCRTCSPPTGGTQPGPSIGTMTLTLNPIMNGQQPSGTASIQAAYAAGGSFTRNNIAIQMLSTQTGH